MIYKKKFFWVKQNKKVYQNKKKMIKNKKNSVKRMLIDKKKFLRIW